MNKVKQAAFLALQLSLFTVGVVILFSAAKHGGTAWGSSLTGAGLLLAALALWLAANSPDAGRARAGLAVGVALAVLVAWLGWHAVAAEHVELSMGAAVRISFQVFVLVFILVRNPRGGVGVPLVTLFGLPEAKARREDWEERIRTLAAQEERHRLARDLHDAIKQQIFAVQATVAAAQSRLEHDPAGARQALDQARAAARDATTEMQALLDQLHSTPVEITGLVEALRHHAEALRLRTDAQVDVTIGELPAPEFVPAGAPEAYFRIAQEALANVARHARASHVKVFLGVQANALRLRVEDDGQGFETSSAEGMGLGNIETRAQELGAVVDITTAVGHGTRVGVYLPLDVPVVVPIHENKQYRLLVFALAGVIVGGALAKGEPSLAIFLLVPLFMWLPVWLGRSR